MRANFHLKKKKITGGQTFSQNAASEEKATSDCGMYSKAIRDLFLDFADTLTLGNPQIAKKKNPHFS